MSEYNLQPISHSFDHDFGQSYDLTIQDDNSLVQHHDIVSIPDIPMFDSSNDFLSYQDPLKHAYKHQFQPLMLDLDNTHFIKPHHVNGYLRNDGAYVEGYFRDGDGNTAIDRSLEVGGGYMRSNPDGNPFNNLK